MLSSGVSLPGAPVSLSCSAECDPVCSLSWLWDGAPVTNDSAAGFSVASHARAPNAHSDTLLVVESTLEVDLRLMATSGSGSTNGHNVTCRTSDNALGPAVESVSVLRVHYPPRNISVYPK